MNLTDKDLTEAYQHANQVIANITDVFKHKKGLATYQMLMQLAAYELLKAGAQPDLLAELLRRELYRFQSQLFKASDISHE